MPFPAGGYAGEGGVSAKRPRAKTLSESQWEPYRRIIEELHRSGYTLNHIKHEMRHKHNFAPTHRQYVHRLKKWGLKRYNADREITWSPGPFGDGDNEEVALYLDSLAPLSGPESASKSSSSPSDDRITSECDSDQSEISRLYLPSPVSLGPQAHLHPGAQNNHGRGACSTEDSKLPLHSTLASFIPSNNNILVRIVP
ncbi:hypothetical protein SODALDRAFT_101698 [Sodiomyces alkalinus F11]|uniref:Clr5 domain-containing protein n=1 Tax=Sodiomyces alkalinus (strain CBS 110278 / VKM F-3762 / F11) TaxID=1314773 RepID=A0A3N2Q1M2_SODAK|nr:hypothetical protein SODALDRAFT_101698 [Sodiomyces alkalinus F11]ROT40650.1 hypothetical protein SODALDRAFT_101698 [Sodiomyces alkalinus F11]